MTRINAQKIIVIKMKNDGLRAYRNYRGLYGPDVQFTEAEKSRVFIKVTKTKTLAAYGQIVDVLFANNKFPLSIEPTELPEGVVADVNFDPQKPPQLQDPMESPYGFEGDGRIFHGVPHKRHSWICWVH